MDAPFYGDAASPCAPGPLDGLWEYEVLELFLLFEGGGYLELECGPHGHWLSLWFTRIRVPQSCPLPADVAICIEGRQWYARMRFPMVASRGRLIGGNACAIRGRGANRRFSSHVALPGEEPDFHQPERFVIWA